MIFNERTSNINDKQDEFSLILDISAVFHLSVTDQPTNQKTDRQTNQRTEPAMALLKT